MSMVSLDFHSTTGDKFDIEALNEPVELTVRCLAPPSKPHYQNPMIRGRW